jgi:hypothetical protein
MPQQLFCTGGYLNVAICWVQQPAIRERKYEMEYDTLDYAYTLDAPVSMPAGSSKYNPGNNTAHSTTFDR